MNFESDQEAFDTATQGVLKQGGPSVSQTGLGCRLRGDSGCKCAIGHLISDDEYSSEAEGKSFLNLVSGVSIALLHCLAADHDRSARLNGYQAGKAFLLAYVQRSLDTASIFKLDALKLITTARELGLYEI